MQTNQLKIDPEKLLLDPNNYRFHDISGYKPVTNQKRYSELGVQERALNLLQNTKTFDLDSLKDSIATNGYVPLEQIVVTRYDEDEDIPKYLIIEGNRRVAAVKTLKEENQGGAIEIEHGKLETLRELPVIEIIGSLEEKSDYQKTLMAIRHVSGIREWGPYQQARLIVDLYENNTKSFSKVAQRIGISSREVARRYRASKALQQMEEDEEFGDNAHPKLYSFFHEAMTQPKLREWLGFSDETYKAENEQNQRAFYELLSPRMVEGKTLLPKLQSASRQVRQLKDIVDKPIPLKILLDPERAFEDSVRSAEEENTQDEAGLLEHSLASAYQVLKSPSIHQWLHPTDRARELWKSLVQVIDDIRPVMRVDERQENT